MNLLSINDLPTDEIYRILDEAHAIQEQRKNFFLDQTAALLFYEPSTRTKMSFEMACRNSGVEFLSFTPETSSVTKGESLYDTVKTMEAIGADFVVIRHFRERYYEELTNISIPIINAGDGTGEHPTQSLLDLMTIQQEFGSFKGLQIAICGDIVHSRVARSNAYALERLGADVSLVSKPEWQDHTLPFGYLDMDEAVEAADVLMLLRVQKERHEEYKDDQHYLKRYGLTVDREKLMKPGAIIMHPAPINRGVEIDTSLVECERSRIFKQMTNGVAIRQAVIQACLNKGGITNDLTH